MAWAPVWVATCASATPGGSADLQATFRRRGVALTFLRHLGIPRRTHPRLWSLATGRGLVAQTLSEPRRHHGDREDVEQFTGGVDQPLAADGAEPEPQMNPSKQWRITSRIGQSR